MGNAWSSNLPLFGVGALVVYGLLFYVKHRPSPNGLKVTGVNFPLNILNRIDQALHVFGVRLLRFDRSGLLKLAEECNRMDSRKLLGDQTEFVNAVKLFGDTVREDECSFSGLVLFNQFLTNCLTRRKEVTAYLLEHPEIADHDGPKQPIIITGLPRTGSTMLYNLLSCDPGARAPRFYEIAHLGKVTPPTTSRAERDNDPRIQSCFERFDEIERVYPKFWSEASKSHRSHPLELEEDLLLLMQEYVHQLHTVMTVDENLKSPYRDWYESVTNKDHAFRYHKLFLKMMDRAWAPDSHWVLKAPIHCTWMDALVEAYPDARIVITHRDPKKVIPSWANLLETYLGWLLRDQKFDRVAYGEYIRQSLKLQADRVQEWEQTADQSKFFNVSYAEMIKDPLVMVQSIYHHFGMGDLSEEFKANMLKWIKENRQNKWGRRNYSLEHYNIKPEDIDTEFKGYNDQFLGPEGLNK